MNRRSNVGRGAFAVAAAAGLFGLLSYSPPQTDLRAGEGIAPAAARPPVAGPFTATPASVPGWPAPPTTSAASTTSPTSTSTSTTVASTTTVATAAPPLPPADETHLPADKVTPRPAPEPDPEPEPQGRTRADAGDACDLYQGLLAALDDPELRTAVSSIGCQ